MDFLRIKFLIDDNPFLSKDYVESLKQEYTGVFYERFILGNWVAAEGCIYPQFAKEYERYTVKEIPKDVSFATIGVDFGGNKSAHAFVCVGYCGNMRRAFVLDEFYLKEEISPERLEQEFIRFVKRMQSICPVYEAFCDNAESTLICGLRRAVESVGVALDVRKAKKEKILERIRFVNAMFSQERLQVKENCRYVTEALRNAVWDESKTEDVRLDDGSVNVDSLDALEYALEPYMKVMMETSLGERRNI